MEVLTAQALNRATLARQHLLRRVRLPALDAVRLLGGLNAQDPNPPYLSLHARLDGFDRDELTGLLTDRRVVRSIFLRATQHLVAAGDFRWMRPALAPVMRRATQGAFRSRVEGIDLGELAAAGRELLAGRTMTRPELGRALAERYPGRDRTALAWTFQYLVPVVHVPPAGTWNRTGVAPFTLAEEWLGGPLDPRPTPGS